MLETWVEPPRETPGEMPDTAGACSCTPFEGISQLTRVRWDRSPARTRHGGTRDDLERRARREHRLEAPAARLAAAGRTLRRGADAADRERGLPVRGRPDRRVRRAARPRPAGQARLRGERERVARSRLDRDSRPRARQAPVLASGAA